MTRGNLSLVTAATALAALFLPCCLVPAKAAEHWIKLRTENFEIYTSNSVQQTTAALQNFERVRKCFSTLGLFNTRRAEAIRIIAFRSESEFAPYRTNAAAVAFYQRSRNVDYIVMRDLQPEHYGTAAHELTHLAIDRAGFTLPLWLNEGLADLYSSLGSADSTSILGAPLARHLTVLSTQPWIDLRVLTSAAPGSPFYTERDKLALFYAESWALTHMLALSERYSGGFQKFVASVAAGNSAQQSFENVYGKAEQAVQLDFSTYLRRQALPALNLRVSLEKVEQNPTIQEIGPAETELLLADLQGSHKSSASAARERLVELLSEYPLMPEV